MIKARIGPDPTLKDYVLDTVSRAYDGGVTVNMRLENHIETDDVAKQTLHLSITGMLNLPEAKKKQVVTSVNCDCNGCLSVTYSDLEGED